MSKVSVPYDNDIHTIRLKLWAIESAARSVAIARDMMNNHDAEVEPQYVAFMDQTAAEMSQALFELKLQLDTVCGKFIDPVFGCLPDDIQATVKRGFPITGDSA